MAKRARTLTGGTGDVKPQILTMSTGTAGAINDYVSRQINLPVSRFGSQKTKTIVFEILSIDWYLAIEDLLDIIVVNWGFLTTNSSRDSGDTASLASMIEDINDPLTFGLVMSNHNISTNGGWHSVMPYHVDMTDGAGNGMLVATDRIFINGASLNGTVAADFACKVKYRLTAVGLQEYIGIVQSQQG